MSALVGSIVDGKALLDTVAGSLIAGVGVTIAFSFAILGAALFGEARRDGRVDRGGRRRRARRRGARGLRGGDRLRDRRHDLEVGATRLRSGSCGTLRNVAIIALLALGVAFVPGGGTVADTLITVMFMGFLASIGMLGYRLYMQNQLTLSALTDDRRALLFAAVGAIVLMIAGTDELLDTGLGTLVWIGVLMFSVLAIMQVWREANTY